VFSYSVSNESHIIGNTVVRHCIQRRILLAWGKVLGY
jgi:hypothetical protein